jgi:uncharacterized membrane protein
MTATSVRKRVRFKSAYGCVAEAVQDADGWWHVKMRDDVNLTDEAVLRSYNHVRRWLDDHCKYWAEVSYERG